MSSFESLGSHWSRRAYKIFAAGAFAALTVTLSSVLAQTGRANESIDAFFANRKIQEQAPRAFALMPASLPFLQRLKQVADVEREALAEALASDEVVGPALARWQLMTVEEQIPILKRVFDIESRVLKIVPPELVIASDVIRGPAFFEFDPNRPGPGEVVLNPAALAQIENKYAGLLLLIHETRHSAQFQAAFPVASSPEVGSPLRPDELLASGFRAAFLAQKALWPQLKSFCDFTTLLNEHEAFQFGNWVVGRLTNWRAPTLDMGTFASQFDEHGHPKLDLVELAADVGPENVLEAFNEREKAQKAQMDAN